MEMLRHSCRDRERFHARPSVGWDCELVPEPATVATSASIRNPSILPIASPGQLRVMDASGAMAPARRAAAWDSGLAGEAPKVEAPAPVGCPVLLRVAS